MERASGAPGRWQGSTTDLSTCQGGNALASRSSPGLVLPCEDKAGDDELPPTGRKPSTPNQPSTDPVEGVFSHTWEVPQVYDSQPDQVQSMRGTLTLTRCDDRIRVKTCENHVRDSYGPQGLELVENVVRALNHPLGRQDTPGMVIEASWDSVRVTLDMSKYGYLRDLVRWICLTFRKPIPGKVAWSTSVVRNAHGTLEDLVPMDRERTRSCWTGMFETAVIAEVTPRKRSGKELLDADFPTMVRMAAVEYPMVVDKGLVLMGYSTALVPVKKIDNHTILWHFQAADHNFQLKPSELAAVKGKWLRKTGLEEFQFKRALIGWCPEANLRLGTGALKPTWSNAQSKPTTWHWTGANLQFVAAAASPLQVGPQAGMTFDRTINTLRFSPDTNYLRCLNSSRTVQIVLYDVGDSRAWLVPLISVYHQMTFTYWDQISHNGLIHTLPLVSASSGGGAASFAMLKDSGSYIVQCSGTDRLTIRELILGFSVNMSKVSPKPPRGMNIYGYEFMDIVADSPMSELKRNRVNMDSQPWISLLDKVSCLFCSRLGEVIHGTKSNSNSSPCNELPKGHDWLATTMHSIDALSNRCGRDTNGKVRWLSNEHYWSPAGSPFDKCQHGSAGNGSCWTSAPPLQEIKTRTRCTRLGTEQAEYCENGAVVFGRLKKPSPWSPAAMVMLTPIQRK